MERSFKQIIVININFIMRGRGKITVTHEQIKWLMISIVGQQGTFGQNFP
jgi:hypothetical protein